MLLKCRTALFAQGIVVLEIMSGLGLLLQSGVPARVDAAAATRASSAQLQSPAAAENCKHCCRGDAPLVLASTSLIALFHVSELNGGAAAAAGRAAAAAGQSGLMALYDSLFGLMDCQAAQVRTAVPLYGPTCSPREWHAALRFGLHIVQGKLYWQGSGCPTR